MPDPASWHRLFRPGVTALTVLLAQGCQRAQPPAAPAEPGQPADSRFALPGLPPWDEPTLQRLRAAWHARPSAYRARTRHLQPDGSPLYVNRLLLESSPYLRQHAHNPVSWYPWGDEAFEVARKLNRPVLLSIGYATCHWCHVMEEESFEDLEIARFLNENYVAIKVDREERPEVDAVYMTAVQMLSGSGGWPMTVWVTPDRKPFYGGTYFPARDGERGVRYGFLSVLRTLKGIYQERPNQVSEASQDLAQKIQASLSAPSEDPQLPTVSILENAARLFESQYDSVNGGLRGAPKFPSNLPISFLFRHHRRTRNASTLQMAVVTLQKMIAGGIHDQIGGGFHRYATDERWLVPHFEKMLYDNALLAMAYLQGYQVTGQDAFASAAREILRYGAREMTTPDGAFYAATDADSPGPGGQLEEGRFYTWTPGEISAAVGAERAGPILEYYAVSPAGNFGGRNILHTPRAIQEVAKALRLPVQGLQAAIDQGRDELYATRRQRTSPALDDQVVVSWNGLMISAYAQAALILGEADYAHRAGRAAQFLLDHLRRDGRLRHSSAQREAQAAGYLPDYAFLISGLLDLHEATGDTHWLSQAKALDATLEAFYEDPKVGGFFMTSSDQAPLLVREKPLQDGAEPSGNSVEVLNLLRLYELTTNAAYRQRAERALRSFHTTLSRAPGSVSNLLLSVDFYLDRPKEIAIVCPHSREEAAPLLNQLRTTFLPNRVLALATEAEISDAGKLIPWLEGRLAQRGKATAYVCEERVCALPTTDPNVFAQQIHRSGANRRSASKPP